MKIMCWTANYKKYFQQTIFFIRADFLVACIDIRILVLYVVFLHATNGGIQLMHVQTSTQQQGSLSLGQTQTTRSMWGLPLCFGFS